MPTLSYHRPTTVAEAVQLLRTQPSARLLAGGQSLIPALKHGATAPSDLVDLSAIQGLAEIDAAAGALVIGAMTRQVDVLTSAAVKAHLPVLGAVVSVSGDMQVRTLGTLGGGVAHNDPEGDFAPMVLALDATLETDRRRIAADDFCTAPFRTVLQPDEILVRLVFPRVDGAGYAKMRHPARGNAQAGVLVARHGDRVRAAVTGAGPYAFRWTDLECALEADFRPEVAASVALPDDALTGGPAQGSAYRRHLVTVMARRAIEQAAEDAPNTR